MEFGYTGLNIKHTQSEILVSQYGYADQISKIEISLVRVNQNTLSINEQEKKQLRGVFTVVVGINTDTS